MDKKDSRMNGRYTNTTGRKKGQKINETTNFVNMLENWQRVARERDAWKNGCWAMLSVGLVEGGGL